jgi:predicted transcriptional regulator
MSTKLTLRLDEALIHRAKPYAAGQNRSLSQLVADYFAHLAVKPTAADKANLRDAKAGAALGPITSALHGALDASSTKTLKKAPRDRDDYRAHLEQKYK